MNTLIVLALACLAVCANAKPSLVGPGHLGALVGASGVVTGNGAAGPTGIVNGNGAIGPNGEHNALVDHGIIGPGVLGLGPAAWGAGPAAWGVGPGLLRRGILGGPAIIGGPVLGHGLGLGLGLGLGHGGLIL